MAPTPEYLRMPFKQALEYFKSKAVFPTENSKQFMAEHHDMAFTVAGLTRADLLEDTRWLIEQAIEQGNDLEVFKKQFKKLVARKGWEPGGHRQRILFETSVRRAHSAGRYQQMNDPELMKRRPHRMWRHGSSPEPRPNHLALDGKVFKADEPFWETAYPMCAYGCKCSALSLSERDLKRMGKKVETPPDPKTIAEPGFQRAAGSAPKTERKQILRDGLSRLSPELQAKVRADLEAKKLI